MDPNWLDPSISSKRRTLEALHLDPHWYACRTRARAEKQVDRLLTRAGFETYLPLVERDRQWADRSKRLAFPLFPGYIFVRFRLGEFVEVVQTAGVVNVVGGRSEPTPVREEELESVRRFAQGISVTRACPEVMEWLEPGTPVRVLDGPFRGLRGYLVENRGRTRVAVRLAVLRMAVCVDVHRTSLHKVA